MKKFTLRITTEKWPRATPLRITGHTFEFVSVVVVCVEQNGCTGRGEAAGIYYKGDTADLLAQRIEAVRPVIEAGISREALQGLLPPGGARNALDCALWDLEAKLSDLPAWQMAGLKNPRPLLTTFTCGAAPPLQMAAAARAFAGARAIKLKLTGERIDADRVRAVREARPDVWLCVDANQGFTCASLESLMPTLIEAHVALIEQPFPIGEDAWLEGFRSPIPIAADESVQNLATLPRLIGRFNTINIKLDKSGGLTEGLAMARAAREAGLGVMVGSMGGTSLAMAPAFLVGQLCDVVDLDGAALLKNDRPDPVEYIDGYIDGSKTVWGNP